MDNCQLLVIHGNYCTGELLVNKWAAAWRTRWCVGILNYLYPNYGASHYWSYLHALIYLVWPRLLLLLRLLERTRGGCGVRSGQPRGQPCPERWWDHREEWTRGGNPTWDWYVSVVSLEIYILIKFAVTATREEWAPSLRSLIKSPMSPYMV